MSIRHLSFNSYLKTIFVALYIHLDRLIFQLVDKKFSKTNMKNQNVIQEQNTRQTSRTAGDGAEDIIGREPTISNDDEETEFESQEFSRLRCSSLQTELIQSENQRRNRQPSAGYPGLAFGSPMFSGTQMKFSLISNELHHIQNVQLKRV